MYALDYIGFGLILTLFLLTKAFNPFHTLFSLSDPHIQHPFAIHERVPTPVLYIYAIPVPAVTIAVYLLVTRASTHTLHVSLLGLAIALILTEFLTSLAKNAIGRPRPDLLDRCIPAPGTPETTLVGVEVCTQTDSHKLQDGFRSFPSGHSSFAFAGLGYLALSLAGQLGALRPGAAVLKLLVCLIPIVAAAGIAISRLEDYRHDPYDVSAGSALGMLVAWLSYRRYFPGLRTENCNEAYAPAPAGGGHVLVKQVDVEMGNEGMNGANVEEGAFELAEDESDGEEGMPLRENRGS
jgi:diacylglycerol diphosphate phosphatase / phosphatidate phosphatase